MKKPDYPPHREDWLHLEYFASLDKKRNPHGAVCILCTKSHLIKDCPHRGKQKKPEPEPIRQTSLYDYEDAEDGVSYGY